jgi:hypothetical protein
MGYTPTTVQSQVIATLGLASRNTGTNVPVYDSTTLGDQTYALSEIARSVTSAATRIMEAICQTEGHEHRSLFTASVVLTHGAVIPPHYGPIGVPEITPYPGANYTIKGKLKSVEEVVAYRNNVNYRYSKIKHNVASGSRTHSKLAGFYALDNDSVYFTGNSAVSMLANFAEANSNLLPDSYHPLAIDLAIAGLKKDGDVSDIFAVYEQRGEAGLALIRAQKQAQPSLSKTIGTRDSGAK